MKLIKAGNRGIELRSLHTIQTHILPYGDGTKSKGSGRWEMEEKIKTKVVQPMQMKGVSLIVVEWNTEGKLRFCVD